MKKKEEKIHLNSTLIEGKIQGKPEFDKEKNLCQLTIASESYRKVNMGIEKEVCFFTIHALGKLGETSLAIGCEGRGLRVVGKLKQIRNQENGQLSVVIVAEHIEFWPLTNKAKKKEKVS